MDDTTRDIWNGVNSRPARRIPREFWPAVRRKLDQIDTVTRLDSLKVPLAIGSTRSWLTGQGSTPSA